MARIHYNKYLLFGIGSLVLLVAIFLVIYFVFYYHGKNDPWNVWYYENDKFSFNDNITKICCR